VSLLLKVDVYWFVPELTDWTELLPYLLIISALNMLTSYSLFSDDSWFYLFVLSNIDLLFVFVWLVLVCSIEILTSVIVLRVSFLPPNLSEVLNSLSSFDYSSVSSKSNELRASESPVLYVESYLFVDLCSFSNTGLFRPFSWTKLGWIELDCLHSLLDNLGIWL
jgi:hypothetical protein